MITLHLHLQPQYKYELFHINFASSHCTGRYELNKLTSLPMCGFIAQLVENRTGIAEVTGSNLIKALIFFRLLLSNCLNWKIYCDDHSSLDVLLLPTWWSHYTCDYHKNILSDLRTRSPYWHLLLVFLGLKTALFSQGKGLNFVGGLTKKQAMP